MLEAKAAKFRAFEEQLADIAGLPAVTLDKRRIELSSNIEFAEEIEFAKVQGSEGIGLFRTESQLIGRADYPSEEEQTHSVHAGRRSDLSPSRPLPHLRHRR